MPTGAPPLEDLRYEIKFVAHASEKPAVIQWVRNHWAGFGEPYPSRRINNVYFDSYELSAFHENLSGTSRRSKVRWRWYGEGHAPERGTLEVKRRRGGLGWKLSGKTAGCDRSQSPPDENYLQALPEQLGDIEALATRGQGRFQIYCAPCHGKTGYGDGVVSTVGKLNARNLHLDHVRRVDDGNGRGHVLPMQIEVRDERVEPIGREIERRGKVPEQDRPRDERVRSGVELPELPVGHAVRRRHVQEFAIG